MQIKPVFWIAGVGVGLVLATLRVYYHETNTIPASVTVSIPAEDHTQAVVEQAQAVVEQAQSILQWLLPLYAEDGQPQWWKMPGAGNLDSPENCLANALSYVGARCKILAGQEPGIDIQDALWKKSLAELSLSNPVFGNLDQQMQGHAVYFDKVWCMSAQIKSPRALEQQDPAQIAAYAWAAWKNIQQELQNFQKFSK